MRFAALHLIDTTLLIHMLSKAKIKYVRSLQQKKFRQKYGKFIIEGEKMADEVLLSDPAKIEVGFATNSWISSKEASYPQLINKIITVTEQELAKLSSLQTPNQALLVVDQPPLIVPSTLTPTDFILYLDEIRDPGNMGTILRIADWFGMQAVVASPACVDFFNPKVVQASMGSILRLSLLTATFEGLTSTWQGLPLYGTVLDGVNVFQQKLRPPALIAIGNESRGLSDTLKAQLTQGLSIPAAANSGAESLNAAVATGIICAALRATQN